jgi:hypothetical protein
VTSLRVLRLLIVEVYFQQKAATIGLERPMEGARRATGIRVWPEGFASVPPFIVSHDEITGYEVDLFPIVMDKGRGCVYARGEAKVTRSVPTLVLFVEKASENLLLDTGRVTWRRLPTHIQIDLIELLMLLLDGHPSP